MRIMVIAAADTTTGASADDMTSVKADWKAMEIAGFSTGEACRQGVTTCLAAGSPAARRLSLHFGP